MKNLIKLLLIASLAFYSCLVIASMTEGEGSDLVIKAIRGDTNALNKLKSSAESGDAVAQYSFAQYYSNTPPTAQSISNRVIWELKAAEQGHKGAQSDMVINYKLGVGVPKDLAKAAYWSNKLTEDLIKRSEKDDCRAQYDLVHDYLTGSSGLRDHTKAAYWARKLVDNVTVGGKDRWLKIAIANQLADMYEFEKYEEPQNYHEAVKWYEIAAGLGDEGAKNRLIQIDYLVAAKKEMEESKGLEKKKADELQIAEKQKAIESKAAERKNTEELQAFKQSLNKMNAGQLFAKADELSTQGDKTKAREALRALVSRFPNHALAAPASQQLATMSSNDINTPNAQSQPSTPSSQSTTNSESAAEETTDESVDGTFTSFKKSSKNKKRK